MAEEEGEEEVEVADEASALITRMWIPEDPIKSPNQTLRATSQEVCP